MCHILHEHILYVYNIYISFHKDYNANLFFSSSKSITRFKIKTYISVELAIIHKLAVNRKFTSLLLTSASSNLKTRLKIQNKAKNTKQN